MTRWQKYGLVSAPFLVIGILFWVFSGGTELKNAPPKNKTIVVFGDSLVEGVGATAGNIVTITLPKTQYTDAPYGDRNGILTFDVGLQFNQNSGDDEISIVMT